MLPLFTSMMEMKAMSRSKICTPPHTHARVSMSMRLSLAVYCVGQSSQKRRRTNTVEVEREGLSALGTDVGGQERRHDLLECRLNLPVTTRVKSMMQFKVDEFNIRACNAAHARRAATALRGEAHAVRAAKMHTWTVNSSALILSEMVAETLPVASNF